MTTLNAHFDGKVFVPDEPVHLSRGQAVRVIVESPSPDTVVRKPLAGFAKGMIWMSDDFNNPLDDFAEYQ